jgi:murein DD-endopeptidase MepM/ murein hydrolase activator NlpD
MKNQNAATGIFIKKTLSNRCQRCSTRSSPLQPTQFHHQEIEMAKQYPLVLFLILLWIFQGCIPQNALKPASVDNPDIIYPPGAPKIISDYNSWYNTIGRPRKKQHKAVDIFQEVGYPVLAAADGKVIRTDIHNPGNQWYGYRIIISHGVNEDGYEVRTVYLHNHRNLVKEGSWVKRGQRIAELGKCPDCATPHLHFAVGRVMGGAWRHENPHQYWLNGPYQITCFDPATKYPDSNFLFTYPVECRP